MNPSLYMLPPPPKDKDSRKRMFDHLWTASDDSLLKSLTDKYATNWPLISECFNASRLTISTDQRTPRDCRDRWAEKWAAEGRSGPHIKSQDPSSSAIAEGTPPPPPPPPSGQMTTRGIKRLASASVSGHGGVGSASGSEPKKRRRHLLIQDTIRKAAKKRADLALKVNGERHANFIVLHYHWLNDFQLINGNRLQFTIRMGNIIKCPSLLLLSLVG